MKKWGSIVLICLFAVSSAFGATADYLDQADTLYDEEQYVQGFALLDSVLPSVTSAGDKAEIYWRLARFQLFIADDKEDAGAGKDELLSLFDKGVEFANKAIELKPSADAYYWRSSNTGRWGETKGILDSLGKSKPMHADLTKVIELDPDYADAWYVFGRLYLLLPGWPISFGNVKYAASFARRSIDVYAEDDLKISYYKSLAEILWKRDWSKKERGEEFPGIAKKRSKAKSFFSKMKYYEGELTVEYSPEYTSKRLGDMSDREEAVIILNWLIREYNAIPSPSRGDLKNINEVKELLDEWT